MAGYIGSKTVNLSTTGADIAGDADVSGALDVGGGLTVDNDGSTVLTVDRATSDGTIIDVQKSGSSVGSIGIQSSGFYIDGENSHAGLRFGQDVIPRYNGADDDDQVSLGESGIRFKDLYLSGGVYLGGTGSANHLDDYESGTWTPVGADASSGGNTASADTAGGFYTKIGRQVTAHCTLSNINTTGMTSGSGFFIQGLPFAHNSTSPRNVTGVVRADKINVDSNCFGMVALISAGASTVQLYQNRDNTTDIQILVSALQSGTADLFFSITYDT